MFPSRLKPLAIHGTTLTCHDSGLYFGVGCNLFGFMSLQFHSLTPALVMIT